MKPLLLDALECEAEHGGTCMDSLLALPEFSRKFSEANMARFRACVYAGMNAGIWWEREEKSQDQTKAEGE